MLLAQGAVAYRHGLRRVEFLDRGYLCNERGLDGDIPPAGAGAPGQQGDDRPDDETLPRLRVEYREERGLVSTKLTRLCAWVPG